MGHGGAQYVCYLDTVFDVMGYVCTSESHSVCLLIKTLHFAVKAVAHQLEGDVGVAVDAWRLPVCRKKLEDLIDVGHIEIATEDEVLGAPVVAAHEGMHKLKTALARSGIAQVAHV